MSAAVAPTDPFADGMYSRAPDPRQKISRSTTAQPGSITPPVAPQKPRRSLSEDQSTQMAQTRAGGNGSRSAGRTTSKAKDKPSAHADTIDRLDYSGIGGGMFHHDGPFDAAAPSRNKGKPHRAPMYAFNDAEGQSASGGINNVPVVDKRLSPLAQATIAAMVGSDGHGPYPSSATASAYPEDSKNNWVGGPIPQRKNTLAEAWGMHEPEPFEEFSAGAAGRTPTDHLEYGEDGYSGEPRRSNRPAREAPPRRSKLPPPQPIALPGAGTSLGDDPASPTEGGYASSPPAGYGQRPNVNRKKSLMQRFRKMRDNPNVPYDQKEKEDPNLRSPRLPGVVYEEPLAVGMVSGSTAPPLPSRHKPTTSRSHIRAKSTDARLGPGQDEAFTIIDNDAALAAAMEKALPAPPGSYAVAAPGGNGASAVGYFDYRIPAGGNDQLTRKSSLLNKVKGAVKR